MHQDHENSFFQSQYFYLLAIVLAVVWNRNKKLKFNKRMSRSRTCSASLVDDNKIIIALQIQNLFVQYSNRKLPNFLNLDNQNTKQTIIQKLKGLFGYGNFYRLIYQRSKVKNFLKTLKSFENVQIYIYTSLQKAFAEKILKKMGIQDYFPEQFRRYCQEEDANINQKKHPSWIDHNTRRVMIVTPNKNDYDEEDRKYFLVLNRLNKQKLLKRSLNVIKQILEKVNTVDQLHAQMDEMKAQIQTEHEQQKND